MHRSARRVAGKMKTSMDRQRHSRESPFSGLTTKWMAVFLIVAGLFLLMSTLGSSASVAVENLPDSDAHLGTVVVGGLGSSTYHRSLSQRRLLQDYGSPSTNERPPASPSPPKRL